MNSIRTVFKNITSMVAIEVVNQISMVILAVLLPRYLGDVGFGQYSFVMSFTLLFSIFLDLGLRSLTIREVSRDESLTGKYLSNNLVIQIFLSILTFSIIFVLANGGGYSPVIKVSLYIMTLSYIFTAFSDMFRSIFYAHQKMEYGAVTLTISRLLITVLVIIFLIEGYGLIEVITAFLIGNIFALALNYRLYTQNFPKIEFKFGREFSRHLIKLALPFGLAITFNTIFFNFDIVVIEHYLGSAVTGWYSLPVYILTVLITFFYAISSAIFPNLSRFYNYSRKLLSLSYEKTFKFLFSVTVPLACILCIMAEKLILTFFGNQFYNSVLIFEILIWMLIPLTLARFVEVVLAAVNKQKVVTWILGVFALLNIVLDMVLIPLMGYMGAIFATVVTQVLVFILDLWVVSKHLHSQVRPIFKMSAIVVALGSATYLMRGVDPFLTCIVIFAVYVLLLIILKYFSKEDLELFKWVLKSITRV